LAGLHSDFMMFLIDEAGAVPQAVAVTAEAALSTGIETKLVISGNPNSLDGPLYRAVTADRHLWFIVKVSGDPDDPKRSPRVDIEWARQQIAQWGRDNAWVKCNVLGEFPSASLNSLLGPEDVLAAMRRQLEREAYEWSQKRIGVDVARFGDDRTVLAPRQGLQWFKPVTMRHARGSSVSTDIAARVMQGKARWGSELEVFDGTGGWSAGALDVLRASGQSPIDCQFHAPAIDPRFSNRRAELWFGMAEAVKSGAALPNEPELVGELTTPTYTFVNGNFSSNQKSK
jgi:phage terminase large subunit